MHMIVTREMREGERVRGEERKIKGEMKGWGGRAKRKEYLRKRGHLEKSEALINGPLSPGARGRVVALQLLVNLVAHIRMAPAHTHTHTHTHNVTTYAN